MDAIVFNDKASIANTPNAVLPTLVLVVEALRSGLDTQLEAIYLYGSIVRGDWEANSSDIDIIGIVNQPVNNDDESRTMRAVTATTESRSPYAIDCKILHFTDDTDKNTAYTLSLLSSGVCIWGSEDILQQSPASRRAMLDSYVRFRKQQQTKLMHTAQKHTTDTDKKALVRKVSKQTVRVLACTADLQGYAMHTSLTGQLDDVRLHAPHLYERALESYKRSRSPNTDLEKSFAQLTEAINSYEHARNNPPTT